MTDAAKMSLRFLLRGFVCVLDKAIETWQCESEAHLRCISHDLRFGALLLRASQLATAIARNHNRQDYRRKIGAEIVDLSRWQADQNLSNRTREQPGGAKAGRRRHENTRGHLHNRQPKCAKQFSPRAPHFLSLR